MLEEGRGRPREEDIPGRSTKERGATASFWPMPEPRPVTKKMAVGGLVEGEEDLSLQPTLGVGAGALLSGPHKVPKS